MISPEFAELIDEVETAIEEYLDARPYSNRFKACQIAETIDPSVKQIGRVLQVQDTYVRVSKSSGAGVWMPATSLLTPEGDD